LRLDPSLVIHFDAFRSVQVAETDTESRSS
jgi:hypothetical protein